jgi:O-antigen/teichoic acid export membrane protein
MASGTGLAHRTSTAAQWRFASSLVGAVLQFSVGVLLARLLSPADFGLVALAFVVLGFARPVGDLGIGRAVIQRPNLTTAHIRTAFTISFLIGLTVTAVISLLAPLFAVVLRDQHVIHVLRILAIGFSIQGTAIVASSLLRRRLDFKPIFYVEIGSYVLGYGAVAILLALRGYGVWSLVYGGLCQMTLSAIAQVSIVRHDLRPLLARQEMRELLHFGLGASGSATVNYVALNGDNFVVGRLIGTSALGFYNRAYNLMNLPFTYAANVMTTVLFPAFSEVQGDPVRLARSFLFVTELAGVIAGPSMVILAIAAPHLIHAVYGTKWLAVVLPLRILCAAGYFRALYHLGGVVAQSLGRVYGEFWRQAVYATLVLVGATLGARYGLAGVAIAVDIAIFFMFIATSQLALSSMRISWTQYFRAQTNAFVLTALIAAIAGAVKLVLEEVHASSHTVSACVLAAAAIPWILGMMWELSEPKARPLRGALPSWFNTLVNAVGVLRRAPAET